MKGEQRRDEDLEPQTRITPPKKIKDEAKRKSSKNYKLH